jgi:hypothetical protein
LRACSLPPFVFFGFDHFTGFTYFVARSVAKDKGRTTRQKVISQTSTYHLCASDKIALPAIRNAEVFAALLCLELINLKVNVILVTVEMRRLANYLNETRKRGVVSAVKTGALTTPALLFFLTPGFILLSVIDRKEITSNGGTKMESPSDIALTDMDAASSPSVDNNKFANRIKRFLLARCTTCEGSTLSVIAFSKTRRTR